MKWDKDCCRLVGVMSGRNGIKKEGCFWLHFGITSSVPTSATIFRHLLCFTYVCAQLWHSCFCGSYRGGTFANQWLQASWFLFGNSQCVYIVFILQGFQIRFNAVCILPRFSSVWLAWRLWVDFVLPGDCLICPTTVKYKWLHSGSTFCMLHIVCWLNNEFEKGWVGKELWDQRTRE